MSYTNTNRVLLIYTGGTIGMGRNPKTDALEPLEEEGKSESEIKFTGSNIEDDLL